MGMTALAVLNGAFFDKVPDVGTLAVWGLNYIIPRVR